jgi:RNA-binding protein Musashi
MSPHLPVHVQDSIVMYDRKTNRSRGFGFVTYENEEDVRTVLRQEHEIMGKWVELKRAEPRETKCVYSP